MNFDINKIKTQVSEVLKHSQGYDFDPDIDHLIGEWQAAKLRLIHKLGGLIYTYPEEVALTADGSRIDAFIEAWDYIPLFEYFLHLNRDSFLQNKVTKTISQKPEIKVGAKLVKSFKYFFDNPAELEDAQNEASRIIQEDKITGQLCISVHPLDFLSASENACKWRSCHSLDGDFRAGNFSYLLDTSTVIVYIREKENTQITNFPASVPWNSKKWRMWLYIDNYDHMLFAGRQYPFPITGMLDFLKEKVLPKVKLYTNNEWADWDDTQLLDINLPTGSFTLSEQMIPAGQLLRPLRSVVGYDRNSLFFNDLVDSTLYKPYYTYKLNHWSSPTAASDEFHFDIGKQFMCVKCATYPAFDSESFLCKECEIKYGHSDIDSLIRCEWCGNRFDESEGELIDDKFICPDCLSQKTVYCTECGDPLIIGYNDYYDDSGNPYCGYHYLELEEENGSEGNESETEN